MKKRKRREGGGVGVFGANNGQEVIKVCYDVSCQNKREKRQIFR